MSATKGKQRVSDIVNLNLPVTKVRTLLNINGVNRAMQNVQIKNIYDRLQKLRMQDNPMKEPVKPAPIKRNAGNKARANHAEKMEQYNNALAVYQKYKSEAFVEAKYKYLTYVKLFEVKNIHLTCQKTSITEAKKKRIMEIKSELLNETPTEYKSTYKRRDEYIKMHKDLSVTYKNLLGQPDLLNAEKVTYALETLASSENVKLFIDLYELQKNKFKVSTKAAVALTALLEEVALELVQISCDSIECSRTGVTILPEHLFNSNSEQGNLRDLYSNLPVVQLIKAREQRKLAYNEDYQNELLKYNKKNKRMLKQLNKEERKTIEDFKYPTFNEVEYKNGFAEIKTPKTEEPQKSEDAEKKKPIVRYSSVGIDTVAPDMEEYPSFDNYIAELYAQELEGRKRLVNIRVSGSVKKVISDILVQLTINLSDMLRILMHSEDIHTLTDDHVSVILKVLLTKSYCPISDPTKLSAAFTALIKNIERKLTLYKNHVETKTAARKSAKEENGKAEASDDL